MDKRLRFMTELIAPLRIAPGSEVKLSHDHDPGYTGQVTRPQATTLLADGVELLAEYQDRLAAQDTFGVLLVLQGIDAAGKDGTIKHVMSGVNPQAVEVHAFKQPSAEELNHDFLWRCQRALPGRGQIGIFNRSHYEEVLVVRVHQNLLAAERMPAVAGQARPVGPPLPRDQRLGALPGRQRDPRGQGHAEPVEAGASQAVPQAHRPPEKNWKFSSSDVRERGYWDDYQRAFEHAEPHQHALGAVVRVPADHKWFSRLSTAAVLVQALDIDPTIRPRTPRAAQMAQVAEELEAELGRGSGAGTARDALDPGRAVSLRFT